MKTGILFLILFFGQRSWSYPDFIGYGYASCMTCHYNGQGNGALNDYGRALWAAEISSRSFIDPKTSDEKLGELSGFIPSKPMPSWFRPGIKFRSLWMQTDPGSEKTVVRYITMQASANAAIHFDQNQKLILVGEFGYMPTNPAQANSSDKPSNWLSREHYLRWQVNDEYFTYVGFTDKVFGIRVVDHTAFNREKTGNAQNDQTHGVIVQRIAAPYEYTAHVFLGNMSQEANLRQKGFSFMLEKDLTQYNRIGAAALTSSNEFLQWNRLEAHNKMGFGKGNSLLVELGLSQNKPKTANAETGLYGLLEGNALIDRGYSLFSQVEYYNQTMTTSSPDQMKWSFGLLAFPYPRCELRFTFVNGRSLTDSGVTNDLTTIHSQLHISL